MAGLNKALCGIAGIIYIPGELLECGGKKLLHISDTPSCFYPELGRLIKILKPEYIVHTGDMADNIKLEFYPYSVSAYEKYVKRLIRIMEDSSAEVIIALGNHDDINIVKRYAGRSQILEKAGAVEIEGLHFRIGHYPEYISENPSDYNLFGHDLTLKSGTADGKLFFNGISSINIIGLDSGNCYFLEYPAGTNEARLKRGKIGL